MYFCIRFTYQIKERRYSTQQIANKLEYFYGEIIF